jgi:hypothetical protein
MNHNMDYKKSYLDYTKLYEKIMVAYPKKKS